jgi:hypothetical protein
MRIEVQSITYAGETATLYYAEGSESDVTILFDDMQTQLLDTVDCYDKTYLAIGYDGQGNKYGGTAVYSCGELVELDADIEMLEDAEEKRMMAYYKPLFDREKAKLDFEKEFHPELIGKSEQEKQAFYQTLK